MIPKQKFGYVTKFYVLTQKTTRFEYNISIRYVK